jgi:hypothetical protein
MNRYFMIRRLTGPSILLLLGIIALLHQAGLVHWDLFVPLLLILLGVLKLAEHAVLAAEPYPPGSYPGTPGPAAPAPAPQNTESQSTAIVSSQPHDFWKDAGGGQS